jgi:hypothetical protein
MKRLSLTAIASAILLLANTLPSAGWGQIGHSTIAQVAQDHLTLEAAKALDEYLDGLKLAIIASDADIYRSQWTVDLGFIPTNPDDARVKWLKEFDFSTPLNISPWSHSITVDMDFNCYPTDNLEGAYINNAAYYVDKLATQLKENARNMDPYERYKAIAIIVHLVGDMHCPMHIVYLPDNVVKGHYFVEYKEKQRDMHVMWDGTIFDAYYDWSFLDMAYLVDTATPKQIRKIIEGDVYDYAESSARDSWPVVSAYSEGDVLPRSYATDVRPVMFSQLRNGGYRLAAIFNEIFR